MELGTSILRGPYVVVVLKLGTCILMVYGTPCSCERPQNIHVSQHDKTTYSKHGGHFKIHL